MLKQLAKDQKILLIDHYLKRNDLDKEVYYMYGIENNKIIYLGYYDKDGDLGCCTDYVEFYGKYEEKDGNPLRYKDDELMVELDKRITNLGE